MKANNKTTASILCFFVILFCTSVNAQITTTYYRDYDGDGYGSHTVTSASKAAGYVKNNLDWKDTGIVNASCWEQVGSKGFTSSGVMGWTDFTVGGKGTAYFVYVDNGTGKTTAMKKAEGDSVWTTIGTASFSGAASMCKILGTSDESAVFVLTLEATTVKLYKSTGSNFAAQSATIATANWFDACVGRLDSIFVAYNKSSDNKVYCTRYNNSNTFNTYGTSPISSTAFTAKYISMDMDKNGFPWIAFQRSSDFQAMVFQCTSSLTWTQIGAGAATTGTASASRADSIKLAVDTNLIPYIYYINYANSRKATVRKCQSNVWKYVGYISSVDSSISVGGTMRGGIDVNDQTNDVYIAYMDSTGAAGYTRKLQVRKFNTVTSKWEPTTTRDTAISEAGVISPLLTLRNGIPYVFYRDSTYSFKACSKRYGPSRTWSGITNTTWSTAKNWYGYDAPVTGEAVIFDKAATNDPVTPTGTTTLQSFAVQSGDVLSIASGTVFAITGDIVDSGTTTGSGKIQLAGTQAQTISGSGTINNLELNNAAGATIASGSTINITDTYTPTAGALTVTGSFVLKSTQSLDAHVAPGSSSGGYIIGTVIAERWDTGRRAFRYFGHPFKNAIKLSLIEDASVVSGIDITGAGGATNGFTATNTNNPSAFYYDINAGTGSTTADPGWTAFTSANSASWGRYQGAKILVRGIKGEGISTTNYTPSNSIFRFNDTLNEGDQTIPLTKLSAKSYGWNLIGNPFPAKINMVALTAPANANATYYVWNARAQGANGKGGYTNYAFGVDNYTLPAYGAVFINFNTVGQTSTSFFIPESAKTGGTDTIMFKHTQQIPAVVELAINDSLGYFWDRLEVILDSSAAAVTDNKDGMKVLNSDLSFFTYSADTQQLSIDTRPYADSAVIKLGISAFTKQNYFISIPRLTLPVGEFVYLDDSFAHTSILLTDTTRYYFSISTDTLSYGANRFSLRFHTAPDTTPPASVAIIKGASLLVSLSPNPATTEVSVGISGTKPQQTSISVLNALGQQVIYKDAGMVQSRMVNIPLQQLSAGVYLVEVTSGNQKMTRQLIKQ